MRIWNQERVPQKPRRILIFGQDNVASTTGGTNAVFHHLCHLLAENGYTVCGACYGPHPARPSLLDERVHFVNMRYHYGEDVGLSPAFNRLLEEMVPDLMIFFFATDCIHAHPASQFNHIPRIIMFHSRPDYYMQFQPDFSKLLRRYYHNAHTQVLMESFIDMLPDFIRRGPVHVIGNSIEDFRRSIDYSVEKKKMVYFSRVDRLKGVELLIEAMERIKSSHPDWSVDIYGDIEPFSYGNELRATIKRKGLENQIHLMGKTLRSKEETLLEYDFGVFPSLMEGFGIGLGEMMSIGLACIGLQSCTGVNEMIIDGRTGYLCPDTPEGFAMAINQLIENPQERKRMGQCARVWMRQYDPLIIDTQWSRLISSILKEKEYSVTKAKDLIERMYPQKEELIVSLTTWKARIRNIPIVLDSIVHQTLPPDRIVLNLAFEEVIPEDIQAYIDLHHIEVNRVPDTKVFKKLIPTLKKYPEACVVSIDDDWIYPEGMLEEFMRIHQAHPNAPISGNKVEAFGCNCHCGCASLTKREFFGPYLDWIDDQVIQHCESDDIVYTFFERKNGYSYIRTDSLYFDNMTPFNPSEPYSTPASSIIPDWHYLTGRFGKCQYGRFLTRLHLLTRWTHWVFEINRDCHGRKYLRLMGKTFNLQ